MKHPAVVVVFAHKAELDWYERISLRQCWNVLGVHPVRLVCPRGMDTSAYTQLAPGMQVMEIEPSFLVSVRSYNRLKIIPLLYDCFRDYEYLLTYELDSFVFRDDLLGWCAGGWDFIGAPWFHGSYDASPDAPVKRGANSGFSLRRIGSARRVLRSFRGLRSSSEIYASWRSHATASPGSLLLLMKSFFRPGTFHPWFNRFEGNEDLFWSVYAANRFPWFSVADYSVAKRFAFDALPEVLFEESCNRLPFGCHKWQGEALNFWRPHIEAFGHDLSSVDRQQRNCDATRG